MTAALSLLTIGAGAALLWSGVVGASVMPEIKKLVSGKPAFVNPGTGDITGVQSSGSRPRV